MLRLTGRAAHSRFRLDKLAAEDPGGYIHMSRVYEGMGHWMNRRDAEAVPWMAKFERNPWPKKIIWAQGDVVHDRFYWLQIPKGAAPAKKQRLAATVQGQTITLEGDVPQALDLALSDQLVDLDQPVVVLEKGRKLFSGKVKRQAASILASLEERADPAAVATAIVHVKKGS